ncbi:hypothetical protein [Methylobacterium sp. 37f]|uniref:hypothetical protein n=1 Tax=Methylobacterium sp. 37f TaxID=2817058 RepID=UPI001FFCA117|nr:hypothetical protein [Methylobacterium sp. 37f]MCK2055282.1 hypothetical protein [Methylobacterium sp. 37f]
MSASPLPQIPPVTKELLESLERRFRGMSKETVAAHMEWAARYRAELEAKQAEVAVKHVSIAEKRRAMTEDEIAGELVGEAMTTEELMTFLADCGFVRIAAP